MLSTPDILNGMTPPPDKEQWQKEYRRRTELLETIRMRELAAMTEEDALRIIKTLGVVEPPFRERPNWSGLVEQQALFHRRRKP